tara:strand:+ start:1613 stop:2473 length:861 start_codon:yes stop_codon:yes gene_type:complete
MIQLNLYPNQKKGLNYEIYKFPDGQQSIKIDSFAFQHDVLEVEIVSPFTSFLDLELIICANQALKEMGVRKVSLYTPYFLGGRSDRKFEEGTSNYLKTVVCPIINSQNFHRVTVLDPHSDVIEACLNNFKGIDTVDFAEQVLKHLFLHYSVQDLQYPIVLVSPDAGALKKVFKIQKSTGIKNLVIGSKNRDVKGQITHTSISGLENINISNATYVIFDDICDGGRTFLELAKVIKKEKEDASIVLAVTHGLFTKGLPIEHVDHVYTTDSIVRESESKSLTIINCNK